MKKSRLMFTKREIRRHRLGRLVNLVLLAALLAGCVAPAAPEIVPVIAPVSLENTPVAAENPDPTVTSTAESATATPAPTWTPGPTPTPRKIVVPSGGSSSSVTVRAVTSTPTPTPQPSPTADATALAIAEGAAPLIFIGLSRDQKCGRGDVVAVDGHELLATPRLLVDNSNFLEVLPEGAQVAIIDCRLWTDEEDLSWLAVRMDKGKLGWMLLQPDKFYVTLFPIALTPPRSLTAIPAGTTVAYAPPSDCEDGPVSNQALATSIGIDLIPMVGDVKGLGEAATGCDLVTGESLGDWRWFGLLGIIGLSELALARHGDDAARAARIANDLDGSLRYGDDAVAFAARNADTAADLVRDANKLANAADTASDAARTAEKSAGLSDEAIQALAKLEQPCSFAGDTPVLTEAGLLPIRAIRPGMLVWAFDEVLGDAGYYPVTAAFAHIDPLLLDVTISGETIRTTPEHPFFVDETWLPAGAIEIGDGVLSASGETGPVAGVVEIRQPQLMYNLTVAQAHTYFVGVGGWLVHNACRQVLRKNMIKEGVAPNWGEGANWQAHHIIPVQREGNEFVLHAKQGGFDFNGAENGYALPTSSSFAREVGLPYHSGPHEAYTNRITHDLDLLEERRGAEEWSDQRAAEELRKMVARYKNEIPQIPVGHQLNSYYKQ